MRKLFRDFLPTFVQRGTTVRFYEVIRRGFFPMTIFDNEIEELRKPTSKFNDSTV